MQRRYHNFTYMKRRASTRFFSTHRIRKSIHFRLYLLSSLLISLMVSLALIILIGECQRNINVVSNQSFQCAEIYLTQLEYTLQALKDSSFFLVEYSINNDADILASLNSANFKDDLMNKQDIYSLSSSLIRKPYQSAYYLYDLEGNGLCIDQGKLSKTYTECHIQGYPDWYHHVSELPLGTVSIYGPKDFKESGYSTYDNNSICAVRGIVSPITWKTIGVSVSVVSLNHMVNTFYQNSTSVDQEFAVYQSGTLLFGIGDWDETFTSDAGRHSIHYSLSHSGLLLENSVNHGENLCIVIRTPLSTVISFPYIICFFIVITIILLGFIFLIQRLNKDTLNSLQALVNACNSFVDNVVPTLQTDLLPKELQEVFMSFNSMSEKINILIHDVLLKNIEQKNIELQLLRTQINPHYLYNTLEIMHMTAYSNHDFTVSAMAEALGKNLQYGLRGTNHMVPLKEEIDQLHNYLSLVNYHYQERLQVNIYIDQPLYECLVLKLIFQPLIENSLLHGLVDDKPLNIDILGYLENDYIYFSISDDGKGIEPDKLTAILSQLENQDTDKIGIYNLNRRLKLAYEKNASLTIHSHPGQGTEIIIYFPFTLP